MRYCFVLLLFLMASSCSVRKKAAQQTTPAEARQVTVGGNAPVHSPAPKKRKSNTNDTADAIVHTALGYAGVRYRYGGTTRKGMDCSGLLYVSFKAHDIELPRVSSHMADKGKRVRVRDVEKGDLLFFDTSKNGKRIDHVGLVVAVENDNIKFIHASTSRGVIVSSLREGYWNYAFIKATRIL